MFDALNEETVAQLSGKIIYNVLFNIIKNFNIGINFILEPHVKNAIGPLLQMYKIQIKSKANSNRLQQSFFFPTHYAKNLWIIL